MTFFCYEARRDFTAIYSDTLATTPDNKPLYFQSKVTVLPHLRLVALTTGYRRLGELLEHKLARTVADGIADIDLWVPGALRAAWAQIADELGEPPPMQATVRLFGSCIDGGEYALAFYRYSSGNDFASVHVDLPSGGMNPPPAGADNVDAIRSYLPAGEQAECDAHVIELAERVRAEQFGLADPTIIGGRLMRTYLYPNGVIVTAPVHDFTGFEDDLLDALDAQQRRNEASESIERVRAANPGLRTDFTGSLHQATIRGRLRHLAADALAALAADARSVIEISEDRKAGPALRSEHGSTEHSH